MSDIKAGKYEVAALFWERPTSKLGEPYDYVRHNRGDIVTLDVEEARRLVQAGAVVEPGARERAAAAFLKAQYEAALAALPQPTSDDPLAEAPPLDLGAPVQDAPPDTSGDRPAQAAPKAQWVVYAVDNGIDAAEAEGMSKQDLIAVLS